MDADQDPLGLAALRRGAARARADARDAGAAAQRAAGAILKDDALLELAANRPRTAEDLAKSRLLLREARRGEVAEAILAAIAAAEAVPVAEVPQPAERGRASPARRRSPTCCGCC